MRRSPYSTYSDFYKPDLEYIHRQCGLTGPTDIPLSPITPDPPVEYLCTSGNNYTTKAGATCDSIAKENSVASAAVFMANQLLISNCSAIPAGQVLCLPLACSVTYTFTAEDSCGSIENAADRGLTYGDVREYNPWIAFGCENLHDAVPIYGSTLCLTPQNGVHNLTSPSAGDTTVPGASTGYTYGAVEAPANSKVAAGTTTACGKWHVMVEGDMCVGICVAEGITAELFKLVNPSVQKGDCSAALVLGSAYCVGPTYTWNATQIEE